MSPYLADAHTTTMLTSVLNLFFRADYEDLKEKPFFPRLITYMASGPVVAMVWEGLDAVKTGRAMLGATNPLASAPGTSYITFSFLVLNVSLRHALKFKKVPFVATLRLLLVSTFAMGPTRSKVPRRRSNCEYFLRSRGEGCMTLIA